MTTGFSQREKIPKLRRSRSQKPRAASWSRSRSTEAPRRSVSTSQGVTGVGGAPIS